jgi:hypothetical protein
MGQAVAVTHPAPTIPAAFVDVVVVIVEQVSAYSVSLASVVSDEVPFLM